jgi:hypothetical protein
MVPGSSRKLHRRTVPRGRASTHRRTLRGSSLAGGIRNPVLSLASTLRASLVPTSGTRRLDRSRPRNSVPVSRSLADTGSPHRQARGQAPRTRVIRRVLLPACRTRPCHSRVPSTRAVPPVPIRSPHSQVPRRLTASTPGAPTQARHTPTLSSPQARSQEARSRVPRIRDPSTRRRTTPAEFLTRRERPWLARPRTLAALVRDQCGDHRHSTDPRLRASRSSARTRGSGRSSSARTRSPA